MDATAFHIEPASTEPIYRQIMAQVQRRVAARQWLAGEVLPSVREMAACHGINPMTVSKAYSLLEAEGVLTRLRGKGMCVAEQVAARPSLHARWELIEPTLAALARQAQELELPPDELAVRLLQRLKDTH